MDAFNAIAMQYYIADDSFERIISLIVPEIIAEVETKKGGSVRGQKYKKRDFEGAHNRIISHYFVPEPLYTDNDFRRRYRMSKHGVLQARWHIIAVPSRLWMLSDMKTILKACIILHNMIVHEKNHESESVEDPEVFTVLPASNNRPRTAQSISSATKNLIRLRDRLNCHENRNVIVDHLWSLKGSGCDRF